MKQDHPFRNFEEASHAILRHLHGLLGFDLWMITRVQGKDWIVMQAIDHGYGIKPGDLFCWTDSFCSRMVEGFGPRIAPSSSRICSYATAPIAKQIPIGDNK